MKNDPFKNTSMCNGFYVKALHTRYMVTVTLNRCRWLIQIPDQLFSIQKKNKKKNRNVCLLHHFTITSWVLFNTKIISFYILVTWSQTVWSTLTRRQGAILIATLERKENGETTKTKKEVGNGKNPEHRLCAVEAWPELRRGHED